MAPAVAFTLRTGVSPSCASVPTRHRGDELVPTCERKAGLVLERKSVKRYVVPLPGSRWYAVIARPGKGTPGLSFTKSGWFHVLILPIYMSASTFPEKRNGRLVPGTL